MTIPPSPLILQMQQWPDVSVAFSAPLKIATSYWRPLLPPRSILKSGSQPCGSHEPTELWRPCTAAYTPLAPASPAPLSSKVRLLVNRDAPCFLDDLGMSEYFSGDGQITHTTEEQCDRIELDQHFVG